MKKQIIIIFAISLFTVTSGCGALINDEANTAETGSVTVEQSSAASSVAHVEPSKQEGSSSSASAPTASASSAEEHSNDNPITQTIPAINAAGFYDINEGGANLTVLCSGVGRYWLSYENSKSLLSYMDFTKLTPTDQTENMEIDSADPGIVFTNSDFSYELRLDQNTSIAVYEIGGSNRYYYTMPDGFYDTAYDWASTYAQYNYNTYTEEHEDSLNITTGHDLDAEE